ncbi:MAG: class I SAM-dependent methyltransferase [Chitinophagaceae bacterium]
MFSRFQLTKKYLRYYFTSSNGKGHGIHSPFVFDFVQHVLNDNRYFNSYQIVESLRKQMKQDDRLLEVLDMGAGSVISASRQRKISDISRSAVKPKKFGQLLFRIVNYYRPRSIIELGTSLGISTSYLALANPEGSLISLEGASEVAAIARYNFEKLVIQNIRLKEGNFDVTLPKALGSFDTLDFAFVDGNHRKEPTLRYFYSFLNKINNTSILIFDDIHWSAEMEEAWELIKAHSMVTLSIDLFFIGIVFFRNDFKIKQHFIINF